MPFDENEFFREATLRICSSLDIEKALLACLSYIQDVIPADRLAFVIYEPGVGTWQTLAVVSPTDILTPKIWPVLPASLRKKIQQLKPDVDFAISDRLGDEEISQFMTSPYGIENFATLTMALPLDELGWGHVALHNTVRPGVFTQEHARFLSLLRQPFAIAFSNCLQYRRLKAAKDLLAEDCRRWEEEQRKGFHQGFIIGEGNGLKKVMEAVRLVSHLDSPVLLSGETGTGKEVIASAIHDLSPRRGGPLIKVNCGAIPDTLIDSHLFGHVKGAFTGALALRRGCFERANGGTIFLDEIGELPVEAQVRLLRVLQEKVIERVGGTEPVKVDIRIIAATHRDLGAMMTAGLFRKDLYFRLNVFPIHIPPLRERMQDLPILTHHFIQKKSAEIRLAQPPNLAIDALDRLMAYDWPGNVRELENAVERELIRCAGNPLEFSDLRLPARRGPAMPAENADMGTSMRLDDVVRRHFERILKMTNGRIHGETGAARLLDINPATLRKRMDKLGIFYGRKYRRESGPDR